MAGQPLNATFFAFRKREKSGVLTAATVTYLIITAALLVGFFALNARAMGEVFTWYGQLISSAASGAQPQFDPASVPASLGMFFLTLIPFMFVAYLLFAAYEAACLRWLTRGETGGFMGLSLGGDTWRVYFTYWLWFGLYMGFSIVFTLLTMFAVGVGAMSGGGDPSLAAISGPALLITLVRLVLMVFFAVRLAPAAATSVGLKRFAFFDAWTVTKGRFWALFGAYLLVFLLFIVAEIVLVVGVFALVGMSAFQAGAPVDPSQFVAALMTPQNMIIAGVAYLVLLLFGVLVYLLMFGINARAVIAAAEDGKITGVNADSLAKTFN